MGENTQIEGDAIDVMALPGGVVRLKEHKIANTGECCVCGKRLSTGSCLSITVDADAVSASPFSPGVYMVCGGCFLKALGVPIPKVEHP